MKNWPKNTSPQESESQSRLTDQGRVLLESPLLTQDEQSHLVLVASHYLLLYALMSDLRANSQRIPVMALPQFCVQFNGLLSDFHS